MKLHSQHSDSCHRRAATLIECLVYIGVFATILGVATSAFYRCYDHMRSLHRNASDITRALQVGETWRADIRAATQPPTWDAVAQTLHIPQQNATVEYRLADQQLSRRARADGNWSTVLTNLNQCEMRTESHHGVTAWRWELELKPLRKPARVAPLFTFTAVPESAVVP